MNNYRITKYDPRLRDASGVYTGSDWTAYSDIGGAFKGKLLTEPEYFQMETAYVTTAVSLLRAAEIKTLTIAGLEDSKGSANVRNGQALKLKDLESAFRKVLREEFWCKFENGNAYVHFGWDYYMYIGIPDECTCVDVASGLFIEEMISPYAGQDKVRTTPRTLRRVPRRK